MTRRAVSKWQSVLEEARKNLSKGGKLEISLIKDKDNSRDMLASTLISIVNAGQALVKYLDETNEHVEIYKSKVAEKSSLLDSFSTSYKELKNTMEANFKNHYEKLEMIENSMQHQTDKITGTSEQIRSFSDAVKSAPSTTDRLNNANVGTEQISHAVKTAVTEINEKNLRESRIIIHGHGGEEPYDLAPDITEKVLGYSVPIISARLMGTDELDPVCVQLSSPDIVNTILRLSGKLKRDARYNHTYISPDRTNEERLKHKKLVMELKAKIRDDPSKWWFIKDGRVMNNGPRRTGTRDSST